MDVAADSFFVVSAFDKGLEDSCDLVSGSKLKLIEKRKQDEIFISAENENKFDKLRSCINEKLFNGIYEGWISLESISLFFFLANGYD